MAQLRAFPSRVPIVEVAGDLSPQLARFQRRLDREAATIKGEAWLLRLRARAPSASACAAFRDGLAGAAAPATSFDDVFAWLRGEGLRRQLAAQPLVTWSRRR